MKLKQAGLSQLAIDDHKVYQAYLQFAVTDVRIPGCSAARFGTQATTLQLFTSADFSTIMYWNAIECNRSTDC